MVDFRLRAGTFERFRKLIAANADASVRHEPGCRQFDVVIAEGEKDRVLLYEVYDDAAAFDAHQRTPHFAIFDRESAACIAAKQVVLGRQAHRGGEA